MSKYPELNLRLLLEPFFQADDFVRLLLLYQGENLLGKDRFVNEFFSENQALNSVTDILLRAQKGQFGFHRTSNLKQSEMRALLIEADDLVAPIFPTEESLYRDEIGAYLLFAIAFRHLVECRIATYTALDMPSSVRTSSSYQDAETYWNINQTPEHVARKLEAILITAQSLLDDPVYLAENHQKSVLEVGHFFASVALMSDNLTQD